jgi:hypothetical protein
VDGLETNGQASEPTPTAQRTISHFEVGNLAEVPSLADHQLKLCRQHRQYFPESYLRWVILATWVLMIVFWMLCWQFDHSHTIASR